METKSILGFDSYVLASRLYGSSQARYQQYLSLYLDFAGSKEAAFSASTLANWRDTQIDEGKSANTINTRLSAVKNIFIAAAEKGYLSWEIVSQLERVRRVSERALKDRKRGRTWLTPEQVRLLIAQPGTATLKGLRDTAFLLVLATSGLRAEEICQLRVQDIERQGENYLLAVCGKNEEESGYACVSREAIEAVQAWLESRPLASEYLFEEEE